MFNLRKIIEEDNRLLQLLEISFSKGYQNGSSPARGSGEAGDKFLGHEIPPETTHLTVSGSGGPPLSPQPPGYPPLEKEDWLALKPKDMIFCWTREGEEKWYDVIRNDQGNVLVYDKDASKASNKAIKVPVHFLPNFWHKMEWQKKD
jgi:hypothetical protein